MPYIVFIVGPAAGGSHWLAGQYLVDYDPTTVVTHGEPTIEVTPDKDEARRFADSAQAHAMWTRESGLPYPRNRPLTAFTITIEKVDE